MALSFQHVHGHQDSGITTVLPHMAWMNNYMDNKAKSMVPSANMEDKVVEIPHEGWVCFIKMAHMS